MQFHKASLRTVVGQWGVPDAADIREADVTPILRELRVGGGEDGLV